LVAAASGACGGGGGGGWAGGGATELGALVELEELDLGQAVPLWWHRRRKWCGNRVKVQGSLAESMAVVGAAAVAVPAEGKRQISVLSKYHSPVKTPTSITT
jgi:hypothetical protein